MSRETLLLKKEWVEHPVTKKLKADIADMKQELSDSLPTKYKDIPQVTFDLGITEGLNMVLSRMTAIGKGD